MPEQPMAWRNSGRCLKEGDLKKYSSWLSANSPEVKSDLPFALSGSNVMLALKTFGNIAVKVNMVFIGSL